MSIGVASLLLALAVGCADLPEYRPPSDVAFAEQNWTEPQRGWFYHASQGTRLMPLAWFLALEQPGLSLRRRLPLRWRRHMARFGFLPSRVSAANPHGLPVGFARDDRFRRRQDGAPRDGSSSA
jgi:hypothetical protein